MQAEARQDTAKSAGDKIYILGTAGSVVQIAYPLTAGGWKVGWVSQSVIKATVSYNANGGSGSMTSSSVQYNSAITLSANKFTKTGYTFSGWNVYRNSDKKWYVSGNGWKTASEISKNGYTKKVYSNQTKVTLDKSWISLGKTNDTFTFYAVWTPNKLNVYYNANGGKISSDTYKLSNNLVYKKANNEKLTQTWTYNVSKTNGLYDASTFGLTREGYTFKGWGTKSNGGTVFDQKDAKLVPTSINSAIKNGNCSTTLYAIWTPNVSTVKIGDINNDGVVNITDATMIQKQLVNLLEFTKEQKAAADTNGDGIVNITDATNIQKSIVQISNSLG